MGELFVWTEGEAVCKNLTTGHVAKMNLPSIGFLKKKDSKVSGEIFDEQNREQYKILGTWNEEI